MLLAYWQIRKPVKKPLKGVRKCCFRENGCKGITFGEILTDSFLFCSMIISPSSSLWPSGLNPADKSCREGEGGSHLGTLWLSASPTFCQVHPGQNRGEKEEPILPGRRRWQKQREHLVRQGVRVTPSRPKCWVWRRFRWGEGRGESRGERRDISWNDSFHGQLQVWTKVGGVRPESSDYPFL